MQSIAMLLVTFLLASTCCARGVDSQTTKSKPENLSGEECQYDEIPGTAIIEAVANAGRDYAGQELVSVGFMFFPDPKMLSKVPYNTPIYHFLGYGSGEYPPRKCVEEQGFSIGSHHPAVLMIKTFGGCNPLVIHVTDFHQNKC